MAQQPQQPQSHFLNIDVIAVPTQFSSSQDGVYKSNITALVTDKSLLGVNNSGDLVIGAFEPHFGYMIFQFDKDMEMAPLTISANPILNGGKKDNYYGDISEMQEMEKPLYMISSKVKYPAPQPANAALFSSQVHSVLAQLGEDNGTLGEIFRLIMQTETNFYLSQIHEMYAYAQETPMPDYFKGIDAYQRGE